MKYVQLTLTLLLVFLAVRNVSLVRPDEVTPTPDPPAPTAVSVPTRNPDGNTATVSRVIDGDTIEITGGIRVRYIGIDTPETIDPRKPVQCFGKEAAEENNRLVLGKTMTLEKDISETDRYGRLLRYVYVNGIMVNDYMVRNGFASAVSYPPDIKHQEQLREAQRQARENAKGLWSFCGQTPTP